VLRHYSRPFWRDRMFWLVAIPAAMVTAAFVAVIVALTGVPATPIDWLRPGLVGLIVLLMAFRLLGMGVTSTVGFQEGLNRGSAPRASGAEAKGRAAGAVVGKALRASRRPAATAAAPAPAPAPDPSPEPTVTDDPTPQPPRPVPTVPSGPGRPKVSPDKAARVAGAMVGRRLAERRRRPHDER
jgi:hypothetical protein